MKKMKLVTFLLVFFLQNFSYAQFKTNIEIGKYFDGFSSAYYTFTDYCVWAHAGYGLAKVNNEGVSFYKFDAESSGNISKYAVTRDSVNVYDDRNFFYLLQTKSNDIWLISDADERYVLQIKNDVVYNYVVGNDSNVFLSSFCEDDGTIWFHFVSRLGPIYNALIYRCNKDGLQLVYSFSTSLTGLYQSYFFKMNDKYCLAEEEYINKGQYFTIFELRNGNKEIFYRFEDKDNGFNSSSHYLYNDELYILKSKGELIKINKDKKVHPFNIKIGERYPSSNFIIVGDEFVYPVLNYLKKINLRKGNIIQSENLAVSEKCKSVVYDFNLSRDGYIYCSLKNNVQTNNTIIDSSGCLIEKNLRILNLDFKVYW